MSQRDRPSDCIEDAATDEHHLVPPDDMARRKHASIPFALSGDRWVWISAVTPEQRKTGFTCLGCGGVLIARKGPKRTPHFAHSGAHRDGCVLTGGETQDHFIVKYGLALRLGTGLPVRMAGSCAKHAHSPAHVASTLQVVPGRLTVEATLGSRRPDVSGYDSMGRPFVLEVTHSNGLSDERVRDHLEAGRDVYEVSTRGVLLQWRNDGAKEPLATYLRGVSKIPVRRIATVTTSWSCLACHATPVLPADNLPPSSPPRRLTGWTRILAVSINEQPPDLVPVKLEFEEVDDHLASIGFTVGSNTPFQRVINSRAWAEAPSDARDSLRAKLRTIRTDMTDDRFDASVIATWQGPWQGTDDEHACRALLCSSMPADPPPVAECSKASTDADPPWT